MQNTAIHWTSNTKWVDLDTGEEITKHNAQSNYIKIKTVKNAKINDIKTRGHIEYINECRKSRQTKLF